MRQLQAKAVSEIGGDLGDQPEAFELRQLAAIGLHTATIAHHIRNELQVVAAALWLVRQHRKPSAELTRDALAAVERASDLSRRLSCGAATGGAFGVARRGASEICRCCADSRS
jgi:hypothetical protein